MNDNLHNISIEVRYYMPAFVITKSWRYQGKKIGNHEVLRIIANNRYALAKVYLNNKKEIDDFIEKQKGL